MLHPTPGRKSSDAQDGARAWAGGLFTVEPPIPEAELAQIAEETSLTERRAAEAERELIEWKKVRFMQDRVGEEFAALVLNPAKYGLFVELIDLFVEGLVPIDSLRDDRYTWRDNTHEIIGERTGRRFRAGDRVQVILDRILAQERRLQFSIVEEGLVLTGRKASPRAKKEEQPQDSRDAGFESGGIEGKEALRQEGQAALEQNGLYTEAALWVLKAAYLLACCSASGPIIGIENLPPLTAFITHTSQRMNHKRSISSPTMCTNP